jgi:hypothetical protein
MRQACRGLFAVGQGGPRQEPGEAGEKPDHRQAARATVPAAASA